MPFSGPRHRLPRILSLLASDALTMDELTAKLDTERRTIELDLQALEAGGITIERIQRSGGDRPGRRPTRYTIVHSLARSSSAARLGALREAEERLKVQIEHAGAKPMLSGADETLGTGGVEAALKDQDRASEDKVRRLELELLDVLHQQALHYAQGAFQEPMDSGAFLGWKRVTRAIRALPRFRKA